MCIYIKREKEIESTPALKDKKKKKTENPKQYFDNYLMLVITTIYVNYS